MINPTQESLDITRKISDEINNLTFHHHYHILYDIINTYPTDYNLNYLEIGCYGGGSSSLVLQRPNTNVVSIDIGHPISKETAINNINKLNKHNNFYQYILGNSHDLKTYENIKEYFSEVDVLFIDGDHSKSGVKKDFEIYKNLIKLGGYIVFDDYNDYQHSPEVKIAVDEMMVSFEEKFEVIGSLHNNLGARPIEFKENNCFIIKKIK